MKEFRAAIIRMHERGTQGAPGHKAYEVQDFLRENCPDFISVDPHWRNPTGEWPPNSPDLSPLDYSIWSILEEKACSKPHPNLEIVEKSAKEGMERNQFGDSDQDSR